MTLTFTPSHIDTLRGELDHLKTLKASHAAQIRQLEARIKGVQSQAVDEHLALWVAGQARELAPTKEAFIDAYGFADWEAIKRLSKPSEVFTWI